MINSVLPLATITIPERTFVDNIKVYFIVVESDYVGQRIDNFLFSRLKGVPKTRIYRAMRKGEIRVNSSRIGPDYKLLVNDKIRIPPIRVSIKSSSDVDIPKRLVDLLENRTIYEDNNLLVLNKPAGIPVHGGSGNSHGVIEIVRSQHGGQRIDLGHRLDRYTSGCLVILKTRDSLHSFQSLLKSNSIRKIYRCIVAGKWPLEQTICSEPLLTSSANGVRKTKIDPKGKSAETIVEVLAQTEKYSLLEVEIKTGRTHQIRAHLSGLGYPIIGDGMYGYNRKFYKCLPHDTRIMLHAYKLKFNWPCNRVVLNLRAPLPEDFKKCQKTLENMTV